MDLPNPIEPLLKMRPLSLLAFSLALFGLGVVIKDYSGLSGSLVFPQGTLMILIALSVFTVGFLFFGYLTPLMMFFAGVHLKTVSMEAGLTAPKPLLLAFSVIMVGYSSIMLGDALLKDMVGRGNFLKVLGISAAFLILGMASAAVGDFLL